MKTLSKWAGIVAVTLVALNLGHSTASAQEARREKFTLPHEVHWQNAIVPAGEYAFSIEPRGVTDLLVLHKIGSSAASFIMLGQEAEPGKSSAGGDLVLVSRAGSSFVRSMQLPDSGLRLSFVVPSATSK